MPIEVSRFLLGASLAPRVELVLLRPDGSPWSLTVSPGVERFIGTYPRLDGFDGGGPLLEYSLLLPTR